MKFEKFDFICNTVDNGVIILDDTLKVYFWNSWLETRTNIKADDIVSKNLIDYFKDINEKTLKRKIKASLALNSATFYHTGINKYLLNIELNKVANKVFDNMQQGVTITPYDKTNKLVVLYIYDNTILCETNHELEQTKNHLEDSLEEISLLLNTTLEAIFLFENDKCVNANKIALELFNYSNKEEVLNKEIYDFIDSKSLEKIIQIDEKPIELKMTKKDNSTFPALTRIKDTKLKNKMFKILTVMDLSELKQKDKLLVEQTKMAALGEMIGNIAHQWRQPLSTISTAASGLKMHKELDIITEEIFEESIHAIIRNSKHLSQTIDDFRDFLKSDKKKVEFDIKENIQRNITILEGTLKNQSIQLILNCKESYIIKSYPNEFTQAFLNIINNAKDAFLDKNIDLDKRVIVIDIYKKHENIILKIQDSAGGIEPQIIDKIFEPYFTTKHKDVGTGLGLYMTHQLIDVSMNGKIEAFNKKFSYNDLTYYGACFKLTLPII
ncbi:PAS domain-containing sensor histidine kinase [Malaciobacter halophilus]|uniref:histidine kinase n=1 Tax=Malaciobacter halophilus TaxID=197482 RepID=A0A2N1J6M7_9BACT|nr:PAS domain-containing sensor histidine kinase [Malaciobacter halophilus]AXH09966.1 PAS sensor-containing two-component system histidine kinase [Malaciobacter halophilus]PKI82184.1 PAS domain-containing sensor histidine kinase [Malaciobacter halophilus]